MFLVDVSAIESALLFGYLARYALRVYGPAGREYIEAHHLTPLAELPEDTPVPLDPREDFAVLCANCHRMMHRKDGPRTLVEIRALARVGAVQAFHSRLRGPER